MFFLTIGQETQSNQPKAPAPAADVTVKEETLPVDDDLPSSARSEKETAHHQTTELAFDLADHMQETESLIRREFRDAPIMAEIAYCESRYRQYSAANTPITGVVNGSDIGVFQINRHYHGAEAKKLGYDLETIEGNMGYGRHLYESQGVQPWVHSAPCWNTQNQYVVYK